MANTDKAVDITGVPLKAPKSPHLEVAYNRKSITAKATWDYPNKISDKKNANRYEGIVYECYFDTNMTANKVNTPKNANAKKAVVVGVKKKKNKTVNVKKKQKVQFITGSGGKNPGTGYVYKAGLPKSASPDKVRDVKTDKYYPYTNVKLDAVCFRIQGTNRKCSRVVKKIKVYNTKTKKYLSPKKYPKKTVDKLKKDGKLRVVTKGPKNDKKKQYQIWYYDIYKITWNPNVVDAVCQRQVNVPTKPTISVSNYTQETRTNNIQIVVVDNPNNTTIWSRTDFHAKVWKYDKNGKTLYTWHNGNFSATHLTADGANYAQLKFSLSGSGAASITPGEAVKMEVSNVIAKGPHGDSAKAGPASFLFAYPHVARIKAKSQGIFMSGSMTTVVFDLTGSNNNYRTDHIKLERNKDFMISQDKLLRADDNAWLAAAEADTDGWEEVGDPVSNGIRSFVRTTKMDVPTSSNPYARTYYRIKTYNDIFPENSVAEYSKPAVHPRYNKVPLAKDEKVEFLELIPESDGTSVRITVAYRVGKRTDPPRDDDSEGSRSDGTEISWSENINAWKSNQGPETFDMPDITLWGTNDYRDDKPNWCTDNLDKIVDFRGYSKVDPASSGYSSKNPKNLGWYVLDQNSVTTKDYKFVKTSDTSPVNGRTYYTQQASDKGFEYTSTGYIMGLSEGGKYYFKARRYLEETGDLPRTYGDYSIYSYNLAYDEKSDKPKLVEPATKPESVTAKVPDALPIGKNLEISWTFDAEGKQSEWEIHKYKEVDVEKKDDPDDVTGKKKIYDLKDNASGERIASGSDASGYAIIPYATEYNEDGSEKKKGIDQHLDANGVCYITVGMATTGDMTHSRPVRVRYVQPPKAALGLPDSPEDEAMPVFSEQPLRVTLGTNDSNCSATLKISATAYASLQLPDGPTGQPDETVVFSRKLSATDLAWKPVPLEEGQVGNIEDTPNGYYSNYQLPTGIQLYDGQEYEISLVVTNEEYDMNSMLADGSGGNVPLTKRFKVQYAKQPSLLTRTSTYILTSGEDLPDFGASLHIGVPETAHQGDLCDIYRVTPDNAYLVGTNVSFDQTVIDRYAPFSKYALTRYRLVTKTSDGMIDWDDFGYTVNPGRTDKPNYPIRFDWNTLGNDETSRRHLEIPYNLDYSDSFRKYFEARQHFGDKRPTGYWNDGAERTSSITTDIIKYSDPEEKEALRHLAQHAGPVMVRRPDGCAYVADVQVNNISDSYSSPVVNVQFTVTEIEMTPEFMINDGEDLTGTEDKEYLVSLNSTSENFQDSPLYEPVYQVDPTAIVPTEDAESMETTDSTETVPTP